MTQNPCPGAGYSDRSPVHTEAKIADVKSGVSGGAAVVGVVGVGFVEWAV